LAQLCLRFAELIPLYLCTNEHILHYFELPGVNNVENGRFFKRSCVS